MGVPKFYRWISERYPCLSEVVKDNQVPEFDNLYLDMNGIIHSCSHPNDDDVQFRITEEQIFRDIFHYIETLFRIIEPKKVFFMAIDGVAPRAKMNQQRARRFMSAANAQMLIDIAKKKGEELPKEDRFDSNCITPGTSFMVRLHEQLQYFVQMKITTDECWRGIRIYLSGHNCPGEGEHKIMDFIRTERSVPGYDPNTRHCLYGLDADLIMLGMCSHEPRFSLLREEVKFLRPGLSAKSDKKTGVSNTTFHLLHLSLLREYLALEFGALQNKLPFPFDMESLIDDWVLMAFLVGNDFIPHLPHVHIHENALPQLYATYIEVLPQLNAGVLNLSRFEAFLKAFTKNDKRSFLESLDDEDYMDKKRGRRGAKRNGKAAPMPKPKQFKNLPPPIDDLVTFSDSDMAEESSSSVELSEETSPPMLTRAQRPAFDSDSEDERKELKEKQSVSIAATETLAKMEEVEDEAGIPTASEALQQLRAGRSKIVDSMVLGRQLRTATGTAIMAAAADRFDQLACVDFGEDEDYERDVEAGWTPSVNKQFREHRRGYYTNKMQYTNITREELHAQAEGYVRAIQWNLHYYYHGCCSWDWFYPHHYAPFISDIRDFGDIDFDFKLSQPFHPFEQLLAVLPAASGSFLPEPFRDLMTDPNSPIIDFYPEKFETDLNGKKQDWEAIVLIPFIDEKRLLTAMASREHRLTLNERERNTHGPHLLFTTVEHPDGSMLKSSLSGVFPDIANNLARCEPVDMNQFRIPREQIITGPLPNPRVHVYFPGFPTMRHLPHTGILKQAGVKVFQAPSRNRSMILTIGQREEFCRDSVEIAAEMLEKEVHVNWPILKCALIDRVTAPTKSYCISSGQLAERLLTEEELKQRKRDVYNAKESQLGRYGIDTGDEETMAASLMVYVRPLLGMHFRVSGRDRLVTLQKQWASPDAAVPHPLCMIVQNLQVDEQSTARGPTTLEEAFPSGCGVFIVSSKAKQYGYRAVVKSPSLDQRSMITVHCELQMEPDMARIMQEIERHRLEWYNPRMVARETHLSVKLVSRITGMVFLSDKSISEAKNEAKNEVGFAKNDATRLNIGLGLKFSKRNEEVPDYTKRAPDGCWYYSTNTIKLLNDYYVRFPEIFNYMENISADDDSYFSGDIWPELSIEARTERKKELRDWLKALPCASLERQPANTETVDGNMVKCIEAELKVCAEKRKTEERKTQKLAVKPNALFRPELYRGNAVPDPDAQFFLLDRVVNVRRGHTVPLDLRGTVIGIQLSEVVSDSRIDVLFDEPFFGACKLRSEKDNCYRVPISAVINLSHGRRVRQEIPAEAPLDLLEQKLANQRQKPKRQQWDHGERNYDRHTAGKENRSNAVVNSQTSRPNGAFDKATVKVFVNQAQEARADKASDSAATFASHARPSPGNRAKLSKSERLNAAARASVPNQLIINERGEPVRAPMPLTVGQWPEDPLETTQHTISKAEANSNPLSSNVEMNPIMKTLLTSAPPQPASSTSGRSNDVIEEATSAFKQLMGIGNTGEPFPQAIVPRPPPVTAVEQLFGVSFALPAKTEQPMQSAVKAESLEIILPPVEQSSPLIDLQSTSPSFAPPQSSIYHLPGMPPSRFFYPPPSIGQMAPALRQLHAGPHDFWPVRPPLYQMSSVGRPYDMAMMDHRIVPPPKPLMVPTQVMRKNQPRPKLESDPELNLMDPEEPNNKLSVTEEGSGQFNEMDPLATEAKKADPVDSRSATSSKMSDMIMAHLTGGSSARTSTGAAAQPRKSRLAAKFEKQ